MTFENCDYHKLSALVLALVLVLKKAQKKQNPQAERSERRRQRKPCYFGRVGIKINDCFGENDYSRNGEKTMRKENLMSNLLAETAAQIAAGRDVENLTDSEIKEILLKLEAHPDYERAAKQILVERVNRNERLNAFAGSGL